jgi:autotransporter-associated beta strand protein
MKQCALVVVAIAMTMSLAAGMAHATSLYWDANSTTSGAGGTPTGTWGTSAFWNTDSTGGGGGAFQSATANSDDLYIVAGPGAASGNGNTTITVSGAQVGKSLTFQASGNFTLSGGTSITLGDGSAGGITMGQYAYGSTAQGAHTISTPVILNAAQTWLNNSANTLTTGNGANLINNGGFQLTVDGTGPTTFGVANNSAAVLSGAGNLVKNGTGRLIMGGINNGFSGTVTINGGVLQAYNDNNPLGNGNLTVSGGVLSFYWGATYTRTLGTGNSQAQVLAGESGFAGAGTTGPTINLGTSVKWGASGENGATGYFNPTKFVVGDSLTGNAAATTFSSGIDLNGTTRTVVVPKGLSAAGNSSTISGNITNGTGTAGMTKEGAGKLILSGANTFNGPVTVSQGTLSINTVANVSSANPLGQSSAAAANLLLANGTILQYTGGAANCDRSFTINGTSAGDSATLDASGTGALVLNNATSPAYGTSGQTRTLILGGTSTYTNTLAANIADNGGAAVSVTKTGAGTWVLTGASTYTGPTTISAGTLSVGASANLGAASANLVINGGVLQIAGTALTSLSGFGHTILITPGMAFALDIASAANTFTVDQALILGSGGLLKTGAGTLILNAANAYLGQTTISGGTLQYNDGDVIPTTPLLNNASLVVNRSGTDTQGATFHSIMGGTGSLTKSNTGTLVLNNINTYSGTTRATAGTISLTHPLALMNSAIDTTGAGAFTLSGVTAPTLGGLSGASGNLASVITTGYSSVTNLILNPSGTVTYGGVIADGAAGMAVTKIGAGTQVLQGVNTYSGATVLNAGTLELSGSGSILNSAVTFSGGGLRLTNAAPETGSGRVADATGITANGGTLNYNNASGGNTYAETIGPVALTSGQLDIVEAINQAGAGSQTLTLAGLTPAGLTNAAITFSAQTTAPNTTKNMIVVSGAGATPAGQVIGPWATVGTAANAQTDYAVYNGSSQVVPAAIAASGEGTWTTAANAYTVTNGATLTATRTITALRAIGVAQTVALGANSLQTYGVLNAGSGALTITNGTLTTPSGGGNLFLTSGNNAIAVNAPITNNAGPVTLVKSGTGGTLTLSGVNTYSGGTVLNAGTMSISADGNLGNSSGGITFNGSATLQLTSAINSSARPIALNNGALATFLLGAAAHYANSAAVTGSGGLLFTQTGNGVRNVTLSSLGNTFTGPVGIDIAGSGQNITLTMNSLTDAPGCGNIRFGTSSGVTPSFSWGSSAATGLTLDNRQIEFFNNGTASAQLNNNNATAGNATTINTDLLVSGTGAKTLLLGGGVAGQDNRFAGRIGDGPGAVVGVTANSSYWTLSGTNTYSGNTSPDNVTLTIRNRPALSPNTSIYFDPNSGSAGGGSGKLYLLMDDAGTVSLGNPVSVRTAQTSAAAQWTIYVGNNGGATTGSTLVLGKFSFASITDFRAAGVTLNVQGANSYRLQLGDVDLNVGQAGAQKFNPTTAPLTIAGTVKQVKGKTASNNLAADYLELKGTATGNLVSGAIQDADDYADSSNPNARPLNVTKSDTGEWTLSGSNTFSGATSVSAGTLVLAGSRCLSDTTNLTISATGKVKLNAGVKEKVGSLFFGAVQQATGTWGSSASSAANTNDTYFAVAGTGLLYVGIDPPLPPPPGTVIVIF